MERGNVLVIGNSGVGKSTLINAVLGDDKAKTGYGSSGITQKLEIYENEEVPFRIIDTVGFEPSFMKQQKAINAVKKWSKNSVKEDDENTKINLIWFCIEGTTRKLFSKTIKDLSRATAMWKSVPIVVVITKSYSVPEREENIEMVRSVFENQKKKLKNLKEIIPVVASTYTLNETAFAAPEGISELIDVTNKLMPEGIKASESDVNNFKLIRKRALAQSVVGVSTASAVAIGAVPKSLSDALILAPIEGAEIGALARIYEINKSENSKELTDSIIEIGTVSVAAKAVIKSVNAIPNIKITGKILNAIIAGAVVAAIGEGSIYVFDKIYTGEKSIEDIEWVKSVMNSKLSSDFINNVTSIVEKTGRGGYTKDLDKVISLIQSTFVKSKG
ncbi:GTPase [Marinilactibacillus psychrotolerans]|uniref:GTPase n=1 Tax=Marinilactibacillus psychrotolerans TaxID=191770 RepID=A0ABW8UGD8_9LACT